MGVTSSVVVVSHRPGSWLAPCLASALAQADEVLLVDNGSEGEEASAIGRALGATVVRATRNLGFAGGVDVGLGHVRGEIVGLLNDDATADPGWLDSAGAVLADPAVAAVTPKVLLAGLYAEVLLDDDVWFAPGDARPLGRQLRSVRAGSAEVLDAVVGVGVHEIEHANIGGRPSPWRWTSGPKPFYVPLPEPSAEVRINGQPVAVRRACRVLNHAGSFLRPDGAAAEYGFGAPDDGRFDQPADRFGFSGTAPVFRAATLDRLGGLAPQFFAYNEDTDWCLRAHLAGLRICYDPSSTVRHRLSATSGGTKSSLVRSLARRNHLLCVARNAPGDVAIRLVWRRLTDDPPPGLRGAFLAKLPWALGSRYRMRALRCTTPRAVWDRWAGVDTAWDDSPARTEAGA